jgi:hypothetical protein
VVQNDGGKLDMRFTSVMIYLLASLTLVGCFTPEPEPISTPLPPTETAVPTIELKLRTEQELLANAVAFCGEIRNDYPFFDLAKTYTVDFSPDCAEPIQLLLPRVDARYNVYVGDSEISFGEVAEVVEGSTLSIVEPNYATDDRPGQLVTAQLFYTCDGGERLSMSLITNTNGQIVQCYSNASFKLNALSADRDYYYVGVKTRNETYVLRDLYASLVFGTRSGNRLVLNNDDLGTIYVFLDARPSRSQNE